MPNRPHYAWLVCLGGCLALMITMGLGVNVFSLYQSEIIAVNGFTNAQGSWITTTRSLFILGALLCVNQLCARFGLRLVMTLGVVLVGLGRFAFGLSESFPAYCLSAAVTGVGYCLGGMVPLSLIIGRWFSARRGLALGIASAGSGISTVFAPVLITSLIKNHGIRAAFFCEGAFILLVSAAIGLLLRDDPTRLGMTPYGAAEQPIHASAQASSPSRRGGVMPVLLAAFLLGGPVGPAFSHLAILFTSEGYDPMTVAGLISYLGAALCVGKVLSGQLYDRLGGLVSNYCIYVVFLLGHLLCALADRGSFPLAFAAITAFALGISITAVAPAVWAADLSAPADYPKLVRAITTAYTLGMLVFGPIPGMLADRMGSYIPAYLLFALFLVVSMALVQGVYHKLDRG